MSTTILCALLASGLAVGLARENRIRRALQDLVARLLDRIRTQAGFDAGPQRRTRHPSTHRSRP